MKFIAFHVELECEKCEGRRVVPGKRPEFGDLIDCPKCHGVGAVYGELGVKEFMVLVQEVVKMLPKDDVRPPT